MGNYCFSTEALIQALLEDEVGVVDVRDNLGSIKGEIALQPNREAFR